MRGRETRPCFGSLLFSLLTLPLLSFIQGVFKADKNLFLLTDPCIHSTYEDRSSSAVDKVEKGMKAFFLTHVCGPLCKALKLPPSPFQFEGKRVIVIVRDRKMEELVLQRLKGPKKSKSHMKAKCSK